MDTIGSMIDKLATINQKMFLNQELLYEVRRMTCEQFVERYSTPEGLEALWETLKRCCDLNVQRAALIQEIDERLAAMTGASDNGKNVQRGHKTY